MNEVMYLINTATQAVAANGIVTVPTISRRLGCSMSATQDGIITKRAGYYNVDANVTFTTPTAGTVIVQLYKNGVAVPGALASVTTTDATGVHTLNINAPVRVFCHEGNPIFTLVNTGVAISSTTAGLEMER